MLTITRPYMKYSTAVYLMHQDPELSGQCEVIFDDGNMIMPVRPMLLHLPYWEIYVNMGLPVKLGHVFFTKPPYNESVHVKIMSRIYHECFEYDNSQDDEYFDKLNTYLWNAINSIDDFGTHELLPYIVGLSLIDMAEVHRHPKVRAIVENCDISEENGPLVIKKNLIKGQEDLATELCTEGAFLDDPKLETLGVENNSLYYLASTENIKVSQMYQVMGYYGLRTEINDRVYKRPVKGNAIDGLSGFTDLAIENNSSRKNVYFAHDAIRLSQYFNREMSIIAAIIAHLYRGYCGNDTLLPFVFEEMFVKNCFGKHFYLLEDVNCEHMYTLTEDNYKEFIDVPIKMYSILTCGHTDGTCERCMGLVSRNHTKGINIGMTASSNLVSEASQLILSTKHEDSAIPMVYIIPDDAQEYFRHDKDAGGIRLQPSVNKMIDCLDLGIYYRDLQVAKGDLAHIKSDLNVPESKYSRIVSLLLRNKKTNESHEFVFLREDMAPFLSTEFLMYIRDQFKLNTIVEESDMFWVPLKDLKNIPIMKTIVYNNSMMTYVTHVTDMFKKPYLSRYHEASLALLDFSRIIFERVKKVNIFQLEILLRAHMITNKSNYSIPVVKDPTYVYFDQTKKVIANRTISGQLAHEGHNAHFADPITFTTVKDQNVLDPFVGV